jgi:SNF family Na+-dependent transporter
MAIPVLREILILPGFFLLFGFLAYGGAWMNFKTNGVLPKFRFIGVVFFLLSLFASVKQMLPMVDPETSAFLNTAFKTEGNQNTLIVLYALPIISLLLLVASLVMEFLNKKGRFGSY